MTISFAKLVLQSAKHAPMQQLAPLARPLQPASLSSSTTIGASRHALTHSTETQASNARNAIRTARTAPVVARTALLACRAEISHSCPRLNA